MTNLQINEGLIPETTEKFLVRTTTGIIPLLTEAAPLGAVLCTLRVSGLVGGLCYEQTEKIRGNAIKVLVNALVKVFLNTDMRIASLTSKGKEDEIPATAEASLFVPLEQAQKAKQIVRDSFAGMKKEFGASEPKFLLELVVGDEDKKARVYREETQRLILGLLMYMPNGVQGMSQGLPGRVETLTNLAVMGHENGKLVVLTSQRSLKTSELEAIGETVSVFFTKAHAKVEVKQIR